MHILSVFVSFLAVSAQLVQNEDQKSKISEQIRVLPVQRTPESNTSALKLVRPSNGAVLQEGTVWIQFRIDGFALGAGSQFDRADDVAVSSQGQTVHIVVDNFPVYAVNEPAINPFNEEGYYYNTSYKLKLPYTLSSGAHTLRIFPARSFGESLKGENVFQSAVFYVGERKGEPPVDLSRPYMTYNEPSEDIALSYKKPVLLDFYISNCELTPDGYKVQLTIDRKMTRMLTVWTPYYIYGLTKGKHQIRLELLDSKGNVVPGDTNAVERVIQVD